MEEKQFSSLTVPSEYLQHWIQSVQHIQALQAMQYQQLANAARFLEGPREERVMTGVAVHQQPNSQDSPGIQQIHQEPNTPASVQAAPTKGKRGRPQSKASNGEPKSKPGPKPKKAKEGEEPKEGKQEKIDEAFKKVKRKVDRFKGMTEAEVMTKTLPDILTYNLDFVIIGINPGLMAAYIGRWFPGPGNHFWKCLFLSGMTEVQLNHMHDQTLPEKYGIGFTNMVARTTPGSKDLSSKELREGGKILVEKLQKYKPLIAVFNGKCIYEMFSREIFGFKPKNLEFGVQPQKVPETETVCYLMPSSSARCAQFPRAQDKVHFYIKLMELRDQLKGVVRNNEVEEIKYTFDLGMAKEDAKRVAVKEEQYDPGYEAAYGGAYSEAGPGEEQSSGRCGFSAAGETEAASKETTLPAAVGRVPEGQWMMQSFTDQIPDISGGGTA
ncbi:G/T mismatch-specific thymine DNA glycosylase-like isoform X1 [Megalops cyprinoides]|uniref:G/T mismatch-specific thymine DNA glycosylase-like isoform X1 n=1 Tax=Megalops cyprinoides TaxID=118141 RepID=UPI0018645308|nr:G/T mismatch-specific thymine DNA glycosylase-like isoform X1 [Megalops cyprinoides]